MERLMNTDPRESAAWATAELEHSTAALRELESTTGLLVEMASLVTTSLMANGRVFFCGNGGSAADSQHLAAELSGRQNFDRAPLSGMALSVDTSALTAIGNDYSYDEVFARQLRAHAHPGDVLFGISTSGRSKNVLRAFETAQELGVSTIAFTGATPGPLSDLADLTLFAPSTQTPHIQQCHITAGHVVLGLVERTLFTPPGQE